MLHYINLFEREYYQNGVPRRDYHFTAVEADKETVGIIARACVKLAGFSLKALAIGLNPANKYKLPR